MTAPVPPLHGQPSTLCVEEARWFAHRLFGRCEHSAPVAGTQGWRAEAPASKQAA
jgi:hypothetical protein